MRALPRLAGRGLRALAPARLRRTGGPGAAAAAGIALAGAGAAVALANSGRSHCEEGKGSMKYRMLGNTGLQVSVLSYGFWASFGAKDDLKNQEGVEMAKECLRTARRFGVNFFDNAEVYGTPMGSAEDIMGKAIEQLAKEDPNLWRRSDIVISTKIFWGGSGVNEKGLSRKHMIEAMEACLRRLRISYVDVLFCHRPDPYTPTETVVRGMSDLVRSGKATCWGTSEWSAAQIMEAIWIARHYGLEPPQFEQPQYHMFHRERFEQEYFPLYAAPYNYGATIWSPLASGLLTGKYNSEVPEGSRATSENYKWIARRVEQWREEGRFEIVKRLQTMARDEVQCTMAQLAIAWCLVNKNVSTVLLGATKPEQLEETLGSVEVAKRLTPAQVQRIDEILGNKPDKYQGYGGGGMRTLDSL